MTNQAKKTIDAARKILAFLATPTGTILFSFMLGGIFGATAIFELAGYGATMMFCSVYFFSVSYFVSRGMNG